MSNNDIFISEEFFYRLLNAVIDSLWLVPAMRLDKYAVRLKRVDCSFIFIGHLFYCWKLMIDVKTVKLIIEETALLQASGIVKLFFEFTSVFEP